MVLRHRNTTFSKAISKVTGQLCNDPHLLSSWSYLRGPSCKKIFALNHLTHPRSHTPTFPPCNVSLALQISRLCNLSRRAMLLVLHTRHTASAPLSYLAAPSSHPRLRNTSRCVCEAASVLSLSQPRIFTARLKTPKTRFSPPALPFTLSTCHIKILLTLGSSLWSVHFLLCMSLKKPHASKQKMD